MEESKTGMLEYGPVAVKYRPFLPRKSRRNPSTSKDNWRHIQKNERTKELVVLIYGGHIVTSERGHRKIVFYLHITVTQRGVSVEIQGTTQNTWVTSTQCTQCDVHFCNKGPKNPPSYQLNQISSMTVYRHSDPTSVKLVLNDGTQLNIVTCDDFMDRFDRTIDNLVPGGIISIVD